MSLLLEMLYVSDPVPGLGVLYDLVMSAAQLRKANKTPLTTLCIDNCVIREAVPFKPRISFHILPQPESSHKLE